MDILNSLESLPWSQSIFLIAALFIAFTFCGILFVRKMLDSQVLRKNHEAIGFVFTNLGVLYGVLVAFTVINVQQRFEKLKEVTQMEASYLGQLYADSQVFSENDRNQLHNSLKIYAQSVLSEEWNGMADIGKANPITNNALKNIWNTYYSIDPQGNKQQAWYVESINKLNLLVNARYARLLGSRNSLSGEIWALLIFGGLIMIAFTWFFGMDSLATHLLISSILALTIAFLLFIIYSLDTVFTGRVSISPHALIQVLNSFG